MIQESITSVRTRTVIAVEVEGLLNSIMMFSVPVHFKDMRGRIGKLKAVECIGYQIKSNFNFHQQDNFLALIQKQKMQKGKNQILAFKAMKKIKLKIEKLNKKLN